MQYHEKYMNYHFIGKGPLSIFTFEPKTLTSCSSYSSVFLFMMSMHGPSSRSNAIVSRPANDNTNKDAEVQKK